MCIPLLTGNMTSADRGSRGGAPCVLLGFQKGYSLSEREYPFLLLPSAALLIFRAAAQRKKCRMAARSPLARQPLVCRVSAGCVCYRPQHCLFSALLCSAKNAGWQLVRRWRGNRSYAAYQQAASVTVRSTAYTFFRCRRGRGRCGRSSAPCAAAFLRCRRPQWWRRCPRPRARA